MENIYNLVKEMWYTYFEFLNYEINIFADLAEAVYYFGQSFDLARGTNWAYKLDKKMLNFSSLIAQMYAFTMLSYANNIFSNSPESAINQAQKALVIVMGGM